MNFKTNLLSAAIAASLLTACGGSSSSSKSAPVITPEPAPVVVPTPTPVEPLAYTFSEEELLGLGKGFVAGLETQTEQLTGGLGSIAGSFLGGVAEVEEGRDGSMYLDGLKGSLYDFMQAVDYLGWAGELLKELAEQMPLSEESSIQLGTEYVFDEDSVVVRYTFNVNSDGQLTLSLVGQIRDDARTASNVDITMTLVEASNTESKVVISGNYINTFDDVNISVGSAEFSTIESEAGTTVNAEVANISAVLGDATITAYASMLLVPANTEEASSGTADHLPLIGDLAYVVAYLSNSDNEILNIASIELSDVRIEAESGEYLTADSILFEDADAGDYVGDDGYGSTIASFEYSEDKNTLTLSNTLGSTVYTFTPAEGELPPPPSEPMIMSAAVEEESVPAQIRCVTESNNFFAAAPRFANVSCSEEDEYASYGTLIETLTSNRPSIKTGPYSERHTLVNSQYTLENDKQGDLQAYANVDVDSLAEPITFSVSANGEVGLAGGMVVPYQLSLEHLKAYSYKVKATIGADPVALTAAFSTEEKDMTISSALPFIPADAAYAPTQTSIEFSLPIADLYRMGADFDEETNIAIIGALTIDGILVAELKAVNNYNYDSEVAIPTYLEFVDGTYPVSGGLFTTVKDMLIVDCPVVEEVEEKGPCFADQEGVVDIEKLSDTFFEGMPVDELYFGPR